MENFIEKLQAFSFVEFMLFGLMYFAVQEILNFLLTKINNKFIDKKGRENNEEKL